MRNTTLAALVPWLTLASAAHATVLPEAAPGWKVEVVAEAPRVLHPTTIACAPDGRVFVCEDYMDMSGPVDGNVNRILCVHPDGRITVFADKLYAVFGMEYLDGKLLVHHAPRFSVFDDAGDVGTGRVDLIHTTNPAPWGSSIRGKNQINDHIPAGFRLGMDGYLYMVFGDKGLYGMVGRDGKRIDLPIGGLLRMRPDATQMEVIATGFRTVLNPVLNAEDEIFIYDNDDHKRIYKVAVGHVIDGGYYGYPWDHRPPLPGYVLPMDVRSYPSGAPTASVMYEEDALPDEYHGNLFLCDWGRQDLRRLRLERDGATYRVAEEEVILKDDVDTFRPTGIALAPDGKSFYVGDWQYAGWRSDAKVGRLLKLTYTGDTSPAPKPAWYLNAARHDETDAGIEELSAALAHAARSVRMVAQRRLAERGADAVAPLLAILSDANAPRHQRWHALWTLDAVDSGAAARSNILDLLADDDLTVRMQVLRQLGTRRVAAAADPIMKQLDSPHAAERRQAVTALGRIAATQAIDAIQDRLADEDRFVRSSAFVALQRIGRSDHQTWKTIVNGLASNNEDIRRGTQFAVRETYEQPLVNELKRAVERKTWPAAGRLAAAESLFALQRKREPWDGLWWRLGPLGHYEDVVGEGPLVPKPQAWAGTEVVTDALDAALHSGELQIRLAAINHLRHYPDEGLADSLVRRFRESTKVPERAAILLALGNTDAPEASAVIVATLQDAEESLAVLNTAVNAVRPSAGPAGRAALERLAVRNSPNASDFRVDVLRSLGRFRSPASTPVVIASLQHSSASVRRTAAEMLGQTGGPEAGLALIAALDDADADVRQAAILALGTLKTRAAIPRLMAAFQDEQTRFAATMALAQMPDVTAVEAFLDGLASKNNALRRACTAAIETVRTAALPLLLQKNLYEALPDRAVEQLRTIYADDPRAAPLFQNRPQQPGPVDYAAFPASGHSGDPQRGASLFRDAQGLNCIACHAVREGDAAQGGPNLAHIASKYKRAELIESVLYPSKKLLPEFRQTLIVTAEGRVLSGLVVAETDESLVLVDGQGQRREILLSAIEARQLTDRSPMPDGLQVGMTLKEFADLIAYLESLQ